MGPDTQAESNPTLPLQSLLILGLLTAFCLLAGAVMIILLDEPDRVTLGGGGAATVQASSSLPTPPQAISVLLCTVRSLADRSPRLEALWVLTFVPGDSRYYFVGLSPAAVVSLPGGASPGSLGDYFAADRELYAARMPQTLKAVRVLLPGLSEPQSVIVFDREILATGVDALGGLTLGDALTNGLDLLARYDAVPLDPPEARLAFESEVVAAVGAAIHALPPDSEPMARLLQLARRVSGDLPRLVELASTGEATAPPTFVVHTLPASEASAANQ